MTSKKVAFTLLVISSLTSAVFRLPSAFASGTESAAGGAASEDKKGGQEDEQREERREARREKRRKQKVKKAPDIIDTTGAPDATSSEGH